MGAQLKCSNLYVLLVKAERMGSAKNTVLTFRERHSDDSESLSLRSESTQRSRINSSTSLCYNPTQQTTSPVLLRYKLQVSVKWTTVEVEDVVPVQAGNAP